MAHGSSRCTFTLNWIVHGDGVSCSGACRFAPACVSRPCDEPGEGVKPFGYGFCSRLNGVMPSMDVTQRFSVRNPKGPTVPCAP